MCDACDGRYTGVYPSMIPSFEDIMFYLLY